MSLASRCFETDRSEYIETFSFFSFLHVKHLAQPVTPAPKISKNRALLASVVGHFLDSDSSGPRTTREFKGLTACMKSSQYQLEVGLNNTGIQACMPCGQQIIVAAKLIQSKTLLYHPIRAKREP
ncbi:MAG: hypothetical protein CL912_29425 [Deltaproteobacteria bacterium]|nr:hypothetical protein [Deltaproteobacteria bacterium]|tara:strand:- start:1192 stop:1566 length:375 start_codon:yes stop_codon:yes gene_type:complete